jgi:phenylpyruvate tautomerase PptA (4-oxalocrotonate tautomerase family)
MPLLKLETNVALSADRQQSVLSSLSQIVAQTIGKPEQYVMVSASHAALLMSGRPGDAALVEVRSIGGLNADVNRNLARKVCDLLQQTLKIPPNRVYLNFTDVPAADWGWNGDTFG